ncbi:unnamed protein product [Paramecium pentaurelia]|uniref:Uncharacterized protein n=1 Tax=Paramecium pentaurelia TaxID=43138 RepID=A0A8S1VQ39_9CILI|nr:unnamed protein product [Paramecium pentaurelia]
MSNDKQQFQKHIIKDDNEVYQILDYTDMVELHLNKV